MRILRHPPLAAGLLAAPVAFLLTASSPVDGPVRTADSPGFGERPAKTVSVSFDPKAEKIRVSMDPVVITLGEEIVWSAGSGVEAFAIDVPSAKEPFGPSVRANGVRARKGGPAARVRSGKAASLRGTYKYTVAVYDGQQVWILDPDIVIN